ncbi:hypothetical protein ABZ840_21870 [Streptomyces sp. NPDC047117]|uniref:hypothetical protein n=1 Tax=Streptomyces sp. NPDC047117 TaxID=3155379 RepID=UPI0033E3D407
MSPPLRGHELFAGLDGATIADFWRFALPDFKMNNARGYLAEFLVHRAMGSSQSRVEWHSHDVETEDGLRIEVKTSAYLQAWEQRRLSAIKFTGLRSKRWNPRTGYADEETYNAHVYVFAVQTARTHEEYDPLDITQWEFSVLGRPVMERLAQKSMSYSTVRRHAGSSVPYSGLAERIWAADPREETA